MKETPDIVSVYGWGWWRSVCKECDRVAAKCAAIDAEKAAVNEAWQKAVSEAA